MLGYTGCWSCQESARAPAISGVEFVQSSFRVLSLYRVMRDVGLARIGKLMENKFEGKQS